MYKIILAVAILVIGVVVGFLLGRFAKNNDTNHPRDGFPDKSDSI